MVSWVLRPSGETMILAIPADPPITYPKSFEEKVIEHFQDSLLHYVTDYGVAAMSAAVINRSDLMDIRRELYHKDRRNPITHRTKAQDAKRRAK